MSTLEMDLDIYVRVFLLFVAVGRGGMSASQRQLRMQNGTAFHEGNIKRSGKEHTNRNSGSLHIATFVCVSDPVSN